MSITWYYTTIGVSSDVIFFSNGKQKIYWQSLAKKHTKEYRTHTKNATKQSEEARKEQQKTKAP